MAQNAPAPNPDNFHFVSITTEEIIRYVPGGYHPAIVGNIVGESPRRQYRLMHKLGWGSFSTVWLAQMTDGSKAFVAVKIMTADDNDTRTQEIDMLQKAAKSDDRSYSHVLKLLDHFMLRGPNGTHTVIVTEVVVPILPLLSFKQPPAWRKVAAYGLVKAMAQLHIKRIIHGDWHLGNIGIAMPQLAHQDPQRVLHDLKEPKFTVVITRAATEQTASLPAYLLSPCNIAAYYQKIAGRDPPQTKVFDFGNAHEIGTRPRTYAPETAAPEIVFARISGKIHDPILDAPADVWALGTIIYQIVTGSVLFFGVDMLGIPLHILKLAGPIPPLWEKLLGKTTTQAQADAEEWWTSHWKILREGCENDEDTNALVLLLRAVLVLDPEERLTAAQIMDDPWFQNVCCEYTNT